MVSSRTFPPHVTGAIHSLVWPPSGLHLIGRTMEVEWGPAEKASSWALHYAFRT